MCSHAFELPSFVTTTNPRSVFPSGYVSERHEVAHDHELKMMQGSGLHRSACLSAGLGLYQLRLDGECVCEQQSSSSANLSFGFISILLHISPDKRLYFI